MALTCEVGPMKQLAILLTIRYSPIEAEKTQPDTKTLSCFPRFASSAYRRTGWRASGTRSATPTYGTLPPTDCSVRTGSSYSPTTPTPPSIPQVGVPRTVKLLGSSVQECGTRASAERIGFATWCFLYTTYSEAGSRGFQWRGGACKHERRAG